MPESHTIPVERRSAEHGFTLLGRSAEHGFRPLRRSAEHGFTPLRRSAEHGFTPLRRSAEHGFTPLRRFAEHGFTPLRRSAEHGFTLIEIMVALAVFSLAALALLRLESATLRGAAILDATVAADMVAQNVAVDAMTSAQPPAAGSERGSESNGGRSWAWTRTVSAIGDGQVMRIDVAVVDPRGGSTLARATMVRPTIVEQPQVLPQGQAQGQAQGQVQ